MIRLSELKLPITATPEEVLERALHRLHLPQGSCVSYELRRRSLDARRRPELFFVYTIDLYFKQEPAHLPKNALALPDDAGRFDCPPQGSEVLSERPLVIGAGPAGLFATYLLSLCGYRPVLLERGKSVEERKKDISAFWEQGRFLPESNINFGEGGAGTFSDGKLNSSNKDPKGYGRFVLETFVRHGANPSVLYEQLPHVGTDALCDILRSMRKEMISHGASVFFESNVVDLEVADGRLLAVKLADGRRFPASVCVFAPGHAAIDSFLMLHRHKIAMEEKAMACGLRIEHPQAMIDRGRYGGSQVLLGPAAYRFQHRAGDGRSVYTFCMCPGGYVLSSQAHTAELCTNGMSYADRASGNANAAVLVSVPNAEYSAYRDAALPDVMQGFAFQEHFMREAYRRASGAVLQQLLIDFKRGQKSVSFGDFPSQCKGAQAFSDLTSLFPQAYRTDLCEGITAFGRKLPGFDRDDAILSGPEMRTTSPVRVLRSKEGESSLPGLYPTGEGCGFAGGILSSAVDGIRQAEMIIRRFAPPV